MAQNYSEMCLFAHNSNRVNQQSTFVNVGENIALSENLVSVDYVGLIQAWYDEVADYSYVTNTCSAVCGHYTQVF